MGEESEKKPEIRKALSMDEFNMEEMHFINCQSCQRIAFLKDNACRIQPCQHVACFHCLHDRALIALNTQRIPRCPCIEELMCMEPISKTTILQIKDSKNRPGEGVWKDLLVLMERYEAGAATAVDYGVMQPADSTPISKQEKLEEDVQQVCGFCGKKKTLENFCQLTQCGHIFCSDCLLEQSGLFGTKTKKPLATTNLPCPAIGCNKSVTCLDLLDVLSYRALGSGLSTPTRKYHSDEDLSGEQVDLRKCATCRNCAFLDANSLRLSCQHIICFDCLLEEAVIAITTMHSLRCPVDTCMSPVERPFIQKIQSHKNIREQEVWKKLLERSEKTTERKNSTAKYKSTSESERKIFKLKLSETAEQLKRSNKECTILTLLAEELRGSQIKNKDVSGRDPDTERPGNKDRGESPGKPIPTAGLHSERTQSFDEDSTTDSTASEQKEETEQIARETTENRGTEDGQPWVLSPNRNRQRDFNSNEEDEEGSEDDTYSDEESSEDDTPSYDSL